MSTFRVERFLWRVFVAVLVVAIGFIAFATSAFASDLDEELPDYAVVDLGTDYSDPIVDGDIVACDITNNHQDTLYS